MELTMDNIMEGVRKLEEHDKNCDSLDKIMLPTGKFVSAYLWFEIYKTAEMFSKGD